MTTLSNISQEQYDSAEATLIALIRAEYPTLDLRRGTVLRDILIRPASAVYALNTDRLAELETRTSLIAMADSPEPINPEWANTVLANFGVSVSEGSRSSGQVIIRVDADRQYSIASGFRFTTIDGLTFATVRPYVARQVPDTTADDVKLHRSVDGSYYYFVVTVVAAESGDEYNITQGVAFDAVSSMFGFITAESYSDFVGGLDAETIRQAVDRLPVAVSYRALESRTAIEAKLRERFSGSGISIQAVSSQGYGDRTQLRDKHNPHGFAVGSRVDVYVRNFVGPHVMLLQKKGVRVGENTYRFSIGPGEAPGFYAIRAVAEIDSVLSGEAVIGDIPVLGSYAFEDVREAVGIADTFHDIDPDNGMIETAYSVFQGATITVTGVPDVAAEREFKVEIYYSPGIRDIQDFVDDVDVRNLEADYIVRCPLICRVEVDAVVYHNARYSIDILKARRAIFDYINSRSFVRRLTRSEISSILHAAGATRVDLGPTGMMLQGVIRDAAGQVHALRGDTLDVESVVNARTLIAPETVVFAAEMNNIHLRAVAE